MQIIMQRIMKVRYFVDKCDIKPPDHTIIACRIILIEGERAGGGRVGGASVSLKWELEGVGVCRVYSNRTF